LASLIIPNWRGLPHVLGRRVDSALHPRRCDPRRCADRRFGRGPGSLHPLPRRRSRTCRGAALSHPARARAWRGRTEQESGSTRKHRALGLTSPYLAPAASGLTNPAGTSPGVVAFSGLASGPCLRLLQRQQAPRPYRHLLRVRLLAGKFRQTSFLRMPQSFRLVSADPEQVVRHQRPPQRRPEHRRLRHPPQGRSSG
jgi:hypothetical protein